MGVWFNQIDKDIAGSISNRELISMLDRWAAEKQRLPDSSALPHLEDFGVEQFPFSGNLMLLREEGGDFRYVYYGPDIAKVTRFDLTGMCVSDFGGDLGEFFRSRYAMCLAEGRPIYTTHIAERARSVHTWERLMLPLVASDGVRWILAYNRPLEYRHAVLEGVLQATPDLILALRALRTDGEEFCGWLVIVANSALRSIFGIHEASAVGQRLHDAFPSAVAELFDRIGRGVLNGEPADAQVYPWHKAEADTVWLSISAARFADGCVFRCADVTLNKWQEIALRESEEKLRALGGGSAHARIMIDQAGRVTHWNSAAEQLFGATAASVLRQPLRRVLPAVDLGERVAQFERAVAGDFTDDDWLQPFEFSFERNGDTVNVIASPTRAMISHQWVAVFEFDDVTALRKLERRVQALEAKLKAYE